MKATRTGRHMGVSPILPPMPWSAFRNLSDEDPTGAAGEGTEAGAAASGALFAGDSDDYGYLC